MTYDELLREKVQNWGHDEDAVVPMIYVVYFENDEWDDYDRFDNEDEAYAFMEEMIEKYNCKCRIEEKEDWDKWHEMYD